MPRTNQERASDAVHQLWNHADHLVKLAENVKYAIAAGRFADALEDLQIAQRPAGLVEMHLRDAAAAVEELSRAPA